jgi:hypothetical protein
MSHLSWDEPTWVRHGTNCPHARTGWRHLYHEIFFQIIYCIETGDTADGSKPRLSTRRAVQEATQSWTLKLLWDEDNHD